MNIPTEKQIDKWYEIQDADSYSYPKREAKKTDSKRKSDTEPSRIEQLGERNFVYTRESSTFAHRVSQGTNL